MALALTIAVLASSHNTPYERDSSNHLLMSPSSIDELKSDYGLSSSPTERVRIINANIQGKLRKGTFETVVMSIEALVREKSGFIVTESLTFKDGLWSGNIVSKLPPTNASAFTIGARQEIDENGRVLSIQISVYEFSTNQTENGEKYSTITLYLSEEPSGETPEPFIQLASAFPILVTGLVWVAAALVVGIPLCFASLGIVKLVKYVIIPLWKKTLSKPSQS